mgnify:CR=1 FL=1
MTGRRISEDRRRRMQPLAEGQEDMRTGQRREGERRADERQENRRQGDRREGIRRK